MKRKLFIMMGLFSLLTLTSCSSDDETTEVSINNETGDKNNEDKGWTPPADWISYGWIRDLTGLISYNNDLQAWHFISSWPIEDAIRDYYPIELGDDFKVDRLLVTVSGNIYLDEKEPRLPSKVLRSRRRSSNLINRRSTTIYPLSMMNWRTSPLRYEHIGLNRDKDGKYISMNNYDLYTDYGLIFGRLYTGDYWLPSFNFSVKPKDGHQVSLTWGTNTIRHNFYDLNPLRIYKTVYEYFEGNPGLKPSRTSDIELKTAGHLCRLVSEPSA